MLCSLLFSSFSLVLPVLLLLKKRSDVASAASTTVIVMARAEGTGCRAAPIDVAVDTVQPVSAIDCPHDFEHLKSDALSFGNTVVSDALLYL